MARRTSVGSAQIASVGAGALVAMVAAVVSIIETIFSGVFHVVYELRYVLGSGITILVLAPLFYLIYEAIYFRSSRFIKLREEYHSIIEECNDLNGHILELKAAYIDVRSKDFGSGVLTDESKFRFKRTRWSTGTKSRFVHNCSAAVCKSASDQPFKYLCKYFGIESTEHSLEEIETVLNDFAAAEQGKLLLMKKRDEVIAKIGGSVPWLIRKFRTKILSEMLGLEQVDLGTLYFPTFTFSYVHPEVTVRFLLTFN
jgi:hypothetical protein